MGWIGEKVLRNHTLIDWVKVLARYVAIIVVLVGTFNEIHQFRLQREKEAVGRYLNIMRNLGDPSDTVRAAAAITMITHLKENYDKYGEASIPVFVNQLAREPSPLVRSKILSILMSDEVKIDDLIKPLVSVNRNLTTQLSSSLIESHIRGEPLDEELRDISKALVAIIEKKLPDELDLSKLFLMEWSSEGRNLEQANFEGARLMWGSFKQANLKKANFQEAELYQVDLTGAFLQEANLSRALLREVILNDAKLNGAVLESANLFSTHLTRANLTGANLTSACIVDANMEGAILQGANLFVADLTEVNLANAILKNADMKNAILEGAVLRGADLEGAFLQQADLSVADLTEVNLANAILANAILKNAVLEGAILRGADLEGAFLQQADLFEADLTDANLAGADLKGANLKGANLDGANLEGADLRAALLFGIDPKKFQNDLDKGTISKSLQQEFEDNRIDLSQSIAISMEEKDRRWLINDKGDEQTYTVRKEERLNICTEPNIVETELFGIESKKLQSDLDKGTISEDSRLEFENNEISLSQNTTVSIEEKDYRWIITDKDNEQTYTVRKEERLKIYKRIKFDPTEIKKARNWQNAIFDDGVKQKLLSQQN